MLKSSKKVVAITVSIVVIAFVMIIPVSAESSAIGTTEFEYNTFDRSVGSIFRADDSSISESIKWGKFWTTGIAPGYLTYMSGGFQNPSLFSNQEVFITVPRLLLWDEVKNIDEGMYINAGDVIKVTGDFIYKSKNRVEIDFVRFGFLCYDENLTTYRFDVDVELSDYNSSNETFFDISHIYDPPNSTSLHVAQIIIQLHIPNFGPANSTDSGQVGFGMFSPGFGIQIGDFSSEIYEEEKATQQGQESLDEVASVIPDRSQEFTNALGSLASSMNYNGTKSSWSVPAIKLPAIPGVMSEVTLVDDLEIDFEEAVNTYIPENILMLVRYLFTIGLVIYCVKELYGLIQYALTLRGGNGG